MTEKQLWEEIKSNPFSILGMHYDNDKYTIKVLNHSIEYLVIHDRNNQHQYPVQKNRFGLFELELDHEILYYLEYKKGSDSCFELDPYLFDPIISDYDLHLFMEGTHRKIWEFLGAHIIEKQEVFGTVFSVWAPNAKSVRVVGDFNNWDKERHFMRLRDNSGIWEIFVPELVDSTCYKFAIEFQNGIVIEKSDPCAFYSEKRPNTASISYDLQGFNWDDEKWMISRTTNIDKPLSIYECHIDSWIKKGDNSSLSYIEIAEPLAKYVKEHGFTHVEFMPLAEYPYDGSWGYQVTGYFAPTSRYGTPHDFMFLVNYLHQYKIGVIMDWVPAHFPIDSHGLSFFDGTSLYEHEDPKLGWHQDWGTCIFNYGRTEVRQFLIANALYWLEMFHIDGLRVDAVASMLYLDYSRKSGEWIPNKYGGRENLEAVEFLQSFNAEVERYFPNVMTIAEESTSYPKVTESTTVGGLGFTYKWNMGWMNDTLRYFSIKPMFRFWHHQDITFSLMYAFSERYILPFSHDEVVHGKGTLLDRMPGSDWEKFANLRLMYTYMWGHPGKKMLFAGQEWAPWQEWSENKSIDWHLNNYILHAGMRLLVKDLNIVYNNELALFQIDNDPKTFMWIDCDNHQSGLLSWIREDMEGNKLLIVINLDVLVRERYRIGVPVSGIYKEIFNSDKSIYGGANILNDEYLHVNHTPYQDQPYSLDINIGPLSGVIFKIGT